MEANMTRVMQIENAARKLYASAVIEVFTSYAMFWLQ